MHSFKGYPNSLGVDLFPAPQRLPASGVPINPYDLNNNFGESRYDYNFNEPRIGHGLRSAVACLRGRVLVYRSPQKTLRPKGENPSGLV
jgi:hypothetical protein